MLAKVIYVGDARYSFQGDTPAEVVRIVWYHVREKPGKKTWRLCCHLRYPDGSEDFAPLEEAMERDFLRIPYDTAAAVATSPPVESPNHG